jgi:drug/metabolite transporter (DMT)-like permease
VAYFNAVGTLSVGVALLLEYSGTVLVVLWVWLRTRRAPSRLTLIGAVVALAGLALVLDIAGQTPPDLVGVMWGLLAAVGLAAYFVASSHGDGGLPPVALAGLGMGVGALALAAFGAVGVVPLEFRTADVVVAGTTLPWWAAVGELALVAAAFAYLLGTYAVRALGATLASFVGLSEVLFAILFAWLLLGELPGLIQLAGGVVVVAGVVLVRLGEARPSDPQPAASATDNTPSVSMYASPVSGHRHRPSPSSVSGTPARPTHRSRRAGTPATSAKSGTSWTTTDPAATSAHRPMVTGAMHTDLAPMDAPSRQTTATIAQSSPRLSAPSGETDRG